MVLNDQQKKCFAKPKIEQDHQIMAQKWPEMIWKVCFGIDSSVEFEDWRDIFKLIHISHIFWPTQHTFAPFE